LKKIGKITLVFSILLFSLFSVAFAQTFGPNKVSLTLKPNESSTFAITMHTGAQPIPKIDVVFAIDITGSMSDEISVVKTRAISIMNSIRSQVPDSDFGVVTFGDYPGRYVYPGYNSTYGSSTDTPWKVNIQPTDNTTAVSSAINSITLGSGSDEPEDYTRALYECISLDWRTLTEKIVILIGDAPTHDLSFAGYNYGGDPGRDGIAQTSDDLVFKGVVNQLRDEGIFVLAVQGSASTSQMTHAEATFKGMSIGFADVAGTGGQYFQLSSADQIPNAVHQMVSSTVSNIKHLKLSVPLQYADWVSYSPSEYTDVGPDTEKTFSVTIKPPISASGSATIPIQCLGDGALIGLCEVDVTIIPDLIFHPKSSKVAMVPDNWAWAGNDSDGGGLYVGTNWPNNDSFTFSNVSVDDIQNGSIPDPLTGFDTVVLQTTRFDFGTAWNNPVFSSRITCFVAGGGKLIIYCSEINSTNSDNANAFSHFIYPFTIYSPGATGSKNGDITNLKNDTLSSTDPDDESYINFPAIAADTDAIGDLTVMVSYDSHWYLDLFGKNVDEFSGPAHTYAFYGPGLIIFNGLDIDDSTPIRNGKSGQIYEPSNGDGKSALEMLWWRELCGQDLDAGQTVNGLTLDPASAVNLVNSTHTVTATVRNTMTFGVKANMPVSFNITSGPNMNLTGKAITNASGQATFSWSSLVVGRDTLTATISGSNPGDPPITSTATKIWVLPGPLSVSVLPSNWTMDIGQTNTFTATPNGGSFNYTSYQWYVNGSAIIGQVFPTYIFTPNATGVFSLAAKVTDSANTTSPFSDNVTVIVNTYPNVTITPVGPLTMSTGKNQTFIANSTGGSIPIHYQWNVSSAYVGTDNSTYTFIAGTSSVNITCAVTDNASIPVTVISNAVQIIINGSGPSPTPPASSGGADSSSDSSSGGSSSSNPTSKPTPTDTPSPTPTPTPPDQYPTPLLIFSFGWVEIAIITLLSIVLAAIVIATFRSFK
jgi:hypothetical protein